MHPRVSLHQVAMFEAPTAAFLAHCAAIGVGNATLVTPALDRDGLPPAGEVAIGCVNHVLAAYPDLERDAGEAARRLSVAIGQAKALGAPQIYLLTGGRGALDWEAAAERLAALVAPHRDDGVWLLVENASAFNVDIHIAHTLPDAIRLAEIAGIGLCIDLHACWAEGDLRNLLRRAVPLAGLVQVSDYVAGDRTAPCRAVPGDGMIPLERLVAHVLDAGYEGLFDIELVGPRIAAEGGAAATARAAERVSELLLRLGA